MVRGPEIRSIRAILGVERELIPLDAPEFQPFSARVRVGGGAAMIESDRFRHVDGEEEFEFSSTSPAATVGLSIGYTVARAATLFVDAAMNWAYVDEDKTLDLAGLAPGYVKPFGSTYGFPYSVGVRVPF